MVSTVSRFSHLLLALSDFSLLLPFAHHTHRKAFPDAFMAVLENILGNTQITITTTSTIVAATSTIIILNILDVPFVLDYVLNIFGIFINLALKQP